MFHWAMRCTAHTHQNATPLFIYICFMDCWEVWTPVRIFDDFIKKALSILTLTPTTPRAFFFGTEPDDLINVISKVSCSAVL